MTANKVAILNWLSHQGSVADGADKIAYLSFSERGLSKNPKELFGQPNKIKKNEREVKTSTTEIQRIKRD